MSLLPTVVLLLLVASASASAATFTCAKPSTCQTAIGYVVPNATTYEQLISDFSHTTSLHDLFAANQLPPDTAIKQAVPARTALNIPFSCRCTGNGVGRSDLYTKLDDGLVEIVTADNIHDLIYAGRARQKPWIPLPCSCDKVDGSDVMHFAYIFRSGDKTLEIAAKYGVPESTLLTINNITNHASLHQGRILDIPLQGIVQGELSCMGTWSRVHYTSRYRNRRLGSMPKSTKSTKEIFTGSLKKIFSKMGVDFSSGKFKDNPGLGYFVGFLIILSFSFLLALVYSTWSWISAVKFLSSRKRDGVMQCDYNILALATDNFSAKSMLGKGQYSTVHKATYEGQQVAVKKMLATNGKPADFHRELQTISKTKHENLVRLEGWCGKTRLIDVRSCWKRIKVDPLLIFELIPNGSLEDHLYKGKQVLPWEKRYKIVKGVGSAIRYLHHECNPCILHRDIKPGNILLDDHFNGKLGDFGLSLTTCKKKGTAVALSTGSMGYMDPRLQKDGKMVHNRKSDVYSFGILLLEIACMVAIEISGKSKGENPGRKSREEIWGLYSRSSEPGVEAAADPMLGGAFDRKQMERVVVLGLKCSQLEETQRPSMEDAMKFLEDGQELPAETQGDGGYSASCSVNGEEEAPMMPHGAGSC